MKSFGSDNNSGVHPAVMDAIVKANFEHAVGYGADPWTQKADQVLKNVFGEECKIVFVFNGTGANTVALEACVHSFHSIICANMGHIFCDECGAPTKHTGAVIKDVLTLDGKLTPELIAPQLHVLGQFHHSQPKVIYISQATEMGTIYTPAEVKALADFAHSNNMYLHMDGARLANACVALGLSMKEMTVDSGVDILSLGGTKNGMMLGEAVIAFHPDLRPHLEYIQKQTTQTASKMRFLTCQFEPYFTNDLWKANAANANEMTKRLENGLRRFAFVNINQVVQANEIFFSLPRKIITELSNDFFFYVFDEEKDEIRLVCSWDTTEDDIDSFLNALEHAAAKHIPSQSVFV
jgi:threonine aldolase